MPVLYLFNRLIFSIFISLQADKRGPDILVKMRINLPLFSKQNKTL